MKEGRDTVNQLSEREPRWFAIYVNYKREKLVRTLLEKKGIETYLPLKKVIRRYERKVKSLEIPLFNCYVFVRIIKKEYVKVLETENVLKFIRFNKDLIAIPDLEISIVKRVVGEVADLEIVEKGYVSGTNVEVVGGAMTGLRGVLLSQKGKNRFLVELKTIGYTLQIEMDSKYLMKA